MAVVLVMERCPVFGPGALANLPINTGEDVLLFYRADSDLLSKHVECADMDQLHLAMFRWILAPSVVELNKDDRTSILPHPTQS